MLVQMKGVHKVKRKLADGTHSVHYYHRATRITLKGNPGSPEFTESFAAAERTLNHRSTGDLAELIRKFEHDAYAGLADATVSEYKRLFKTIDKKWGTCPIAALEDLEFRKDVIAWRNKIAKQTPREADNLAALIARVISHHVKAGEIRSNVLADLPRVYKSDRSDKIWEPHHIKLFNGAASPGMKLAMLLALHTGQREGDLLRLPWSAYDGERITLVQSKRGMRVSIRCTAELKAMLDALPKRSPLIMTTVTGRAWKTRYFCRQWLDTTIRAGINEDLHFHDVRGTTVTLLAEAGCSVPEIASITGHTIKSAAAILDVYLARTKRLADGAIGKLEVRLQTVV